jgi:hypothetical protein
MAKRHGIGKDSVARIWKDHNLKPWRVERFKVSNDPRFEEKLIDVVGLYLNPPERAAVFCFDEKTQVQALDRTQPSLPMTPGRAGTMTHDYKRNGTTDLFAALNVGTGEVLTECRKSHNHSRKPGRTTADRTAADSAICSRRIRREVSRNARRRRTAEVPSDAGSGSSQPPNRDHASGAPHDRFWTALTLRRERWAEDRLAVTLHELDDRFPVEDGLARRRQAERASRRCDLAEEPFDAGRTEEQKQPGLVGIDVERVADSARRVDERAGHTLDHVIAVLEADRAGEHKEELVLVVVDVKGRGEALRRSELESGVAAVRLFGHCSQEAERTVEPQCLTVVGSQRVAAGRFRKRPRHTHGPLKFHHLQLAPVRRADLVARVEALHGGLSHCSSPFRFSRLFLEQM